MAETNYVNEKSTGYITIVSTDKTGAPAVPDTMFYKIYDVQTNAVVRGPTEVDTPSSSVEIELTPSDTTIINEEQDNERKRLTVESTFAGGRVHNSEYIYIVRALKNVS